MNEMDQFRATYFDECSELLLELEEQFAALAGGARDSERLNAVFRAIHSIKGGAGAFGFDALVAFAHAFETLLDHVRNGTIVLGDEVIALGMRSIDIVADLVAAARADEAPPAGLGLEEQMRFAVLCEGHNADDALLEDFDIDFTPVRVVLPGDAGVSGAEDDEDDLAPGFVPVAVTLPGLDQPAPVAAGWLVRMRPLPGFYAQGNDPQVLVRALALLGETEVIAEIDDDLPTLEAFDPAGIYGGWTVFVRGEGIAEGAVRDVFDFAGGVCGVEILPLPGASSGGDKHEDDAFPDAAPLSLLDLAGLQEQAAPPAPEPVVAPAQMQAPAAMATRMRPEEEGVRAPAAAASIRVDLDKVDRVVNMVGELVITQSMLTQQMDDAIRDRYQELVRGLEVLAQTTRGLQDAVMSIRAQPVKSVFSRMPRLVRELAAKTGKAIRLDMVGEATEIDRTVIEQLSDPLTHMVRNCADHGIESPEMRRAAGKPETGTIRLSAAQAGGNILITVEDDGQGINRARVLDIARQRGVVAPDQQLSDEQIDNLIFAPGFSTASAVSDISGRGVGMDVVLSNIKKIGGSVLVRSTPGRGTRMTLRLPLTLAVLDVMLVRVGGSPYVVPLSSIIETIQHARADFSEMPSGDPVLQVRGAWVQVIDLASQFGFVHGVPPDQRFVVLCEAEGDKRVAMVVDEIIGQQQVVIKSLEANFERIEGIAGATILGDGNVALILDVQGLSAMERPRRAA